MHYQEIRPAEQLSKFVKCFWILESPSAPSPNQERILPDGCTEIVFHTADPFTQHNPDGTTERQPLALLVGQMRSHLLIQPTGRVRVLGVRFWPGGAYPFLMLPQNEIADKVIALDSIWGPITGELQSRIADAANATETVRQVETILIARLGKFKRHDDAIDAAIDRAVASIFRSGGSVPVERLAENIGVGLRRLDRKFNTQVGLPPKMLSRIARFQRVLRMLERQENKQDFVRIALDCGYYDQSHFIKEFKAFAGKGPTSYFGEQNVMTDYFTAGS